MALHLRKPGPSGSLGGGFALAPERADTWGIVPSGSRNEKAMCERRHGNCGKGHVPQELLPIPFSSPTFCLETAHVPRNWTHLLKSRMPMEMEGVSACDWFSAHNLFQFTTLSGSASTSLPTRICLRLAPTMRQTGFPFKSFLLALECMFAEDYPWPKSGVHTHILENP